MIGLKIIIKLHPDGLWAVWSKKQMGSGTETIVKWNEEKDEKKIKISNF